MTILLKLRRESGKNYRNLRKGYLEEVQDKEKTEEIRLKILKERLIKVGIFENFVD